MARKVMSQAAKGQSQAPKFYVFRLGEKPGTPRRPLAACQTREDAEAVAARCPFPTHLVQWSTS